MSARRLQVRRRGQLDELEIKAELGPLGICLDASLVPRLARVFECMAAAAGRAACTADSHKEAETAPTRKDRGTDGDEGDDEGGGPCRLEASLSIPAVRLLHSVNLFGPPLRLLAEHSVAALLHQVCKLSLRPDRSDATQLAVGRAKVSPLGAVMTAP